MAGERTLEGVGVVVTRGEGPDGPLSLLLKEKGARVLNWGSIGFAPPRDPAALEEALARIGRYDWICFSSPRAVEAVLDRLPRQPAGLRVAAVGPSTSAALEARGWVVERVPQEGGGEALVALFAEAGGLGGARVLFPASAIARAAIPVGLTELGARVDQVTAYRLVSRPLDREACEAAIERGEVQVVTFASPSAMEGLRESLGPALFAGLARQSPGAAMGKTTAMALKEAGWQRIGMAREPTLEGLVGAAERLAEELGASPAHTRDDGSKG